MQVQGWKSQEEWEDWFNRLTVSEKKQVQKDLENAPRVGPTEGPQTMAYNTGAFVTGYGGAAGGGKSALLAMLAVQQHQRTLIVRANAEEVSNIIDDMVEFSGTNQGLNRQDKVFRLTKRRGQMIEWTGLSKPGSQFRWRGIPHDLLGFDEVTELPEHMVRFLFTWVRTTVVGLRARVVMTFNPPTTDEGRWIIKFFAPWLDERHPNPAKPGELRYFYQDPETEEEVEVLSPRPIAMKIGGKDFVVEPESRTFIPATVQDNPFLLKTNYVQTLVNLPEPFRTQMLLGDFRSGIVDSPYQVIPTKWVDDAQERWTDAGRYRPMSALGVDVARGGANMTVLSPRHDFWWDKLDRYPGAETPDGEATAGFAVARVRDGAPINIDSTGVGSSPYDVLKKAGLALNPVIFNQVKIDFRMIPETHMKFFNLRSLLWWYLYKILDPVNRCNAALPDDDKLRSEIIAVRKEMRDAIKFKVENKDELKDRIGYSPDDADSVVCSLFNLFSEEMLFRRIDSRYTQKADMSKLMNRPIITPVDAGLAGSVKNNSWMVR